MTTRIAYIFPRKSVFGPRGAESIELCVRDLAQFSRFRQQTRIFCPKIEAPFDDVDVEMLDPPGLGGNPRNALRLARKIDGGGFDAAIVEQHLPTTALVAAFADRPVIMHTHYYERTPKRPLKAALQKLKYRPLAGLVFVSESCAAHFRAHYPSVAARIGVVPNGLDMRTWAADRPKVKRILVVGRGLADKGHAEAMAAIVSCLADAPDWTAQFILSRTEVQPDYVAALRAAALKAPGRIAIDANLPYAEVKAAWEQAAIGMVLTRSPEPFGRTALEALASGAALVSSGLGGLAEVSGPHARIVDPTATGEVAAALSALMRDKETRAALAARGRAHAEKLFDIRVVAAKMDIFVEGVVAARHGQGG